MTALRAVQIRHDEAPSTVRLVNLVAGLRATSELWRKAAEREAKVRADSESWHRAALAWVAAGAFLVGILVTLLCAWAGALLTAGGEGESHARSSPRKGHCPSSLPPHPHGSCEQRVGVPLETSSRLGTRGHRWKAVPVVRALW